MSTKAKVITTVVVIWWVAMIGITIWFGTHKVVDKYTIEEYTRLVAKGPVPSPPIVVDTTTLTWWLAAVTACAAIGVLMAAVWTSKASAGTITTNHNQLENNK